MDLIDLIVAFGVLIMIIFFGALSFSIQLELEEQRTDYRGIIEKYPECVDEVGVYGSYSAFMCCEDCHDINFSFWKFEGKQERYNNNCWCLDKDKRPIQVW